MPPKLAALDFTVFPSPSLVELQNFNVPSPAQPAAGHLTPPPPQMPQPGRRGAQAHMRALIEATAYPHVSDGSAPPAPDLQQLDADLEQFAAQIAHHSAQAGTGSGPAGGASAHNQVAHRSTELCRALVSSLEAGFSVRGGYSDPAMAAAMHRAGEFLAQTLDGTKKLGANYLTSLARDGGITTATTMLRELIGYAVVHHNTLSESQKTAVAAGIMGFAIVLNLAAMAIQGLKGTGNLRTRTGQGINIALLGVVMFVAHKTSTLATVMPLLVKAIAYSLMRDSTNDFLTMRDARDTSGKPPAALAIVIQSSFYVAVNIIVNYLQGSAVSISGPAAAANGLALKHALLPMLAFSAFNGVAEGADGANFSHIIAYQQSRARRLAGGQPADGRKGATDVDLKVKLRVPTWSQYLDKVSGPMTGRASAFTVIYGMIGALSQVPMSDDKRVHFMNCMIGLAIGSFVGIFVAGFSTSTPAPRQVVDPSPV